MENSVSDKITSFLAKHPKDVFKINTIIKNLGLAHLKKSTIKGELKNLLTKGTITREGKLFKITSDSSVDEPKRDKSKKTQGKKPRKSFSDKTFKQTSNKKDVRHNERRKREREKTFKRVKDYERNEQRQETLKTQLSENLEAFKTVTGKYEYGR